MHVWHPSTPFSAGAVCPRGVSAFRWWPASGWSGSSGRGIDPAPGTARPRRDVTWVRGVEAARFRHDLAVADRLCQPGPGDHADTTDRQSVADDQATGASAATAAGRHLTLALGPPSAPGARGRRIAIRRLDRSASRGRPTDAASAGLALARRGPRIRRSAARRPEGCGSDDLAEPCADPGPGRATTRSRRGLIGLRCHFKRWPRQAARGDPPWSSLARYRGGR